MGIKFHDLRTVQTACKPALLKALHFAIFYYNYADLIFTKLLLIIKMIKSRRMRWTGHVACMGEMRISYKILVGKPEGERTLGRPRCRCEDNIIMDLKETGWKSVNWLHLAQDREQ
jgi:hypothetical protein